jgi:hypothetical protein
LPLLLVGAAGCLDGPLFALKKANPYFRREWAKDVAIGPTYYERIEELRLLKQQLAAMPEDEQSKWLVHLDAIVKHDPSPEMRREAVLALGSVQSQQSESIIQSAASDSSAKVRMAVCQSIARQSEKAAYPILQKMLKDEDEDGVQKEAVLALGNFDSTESRGMLTAVLQEKSPAMQYVATQALAKSTGMHYGGDVAKWKSYLAGELTEDEVPSLAERAAEWIKFY